MRPRSSIIAAGILVFVSSSIAGAQGRQDLSGTWEWQGAEGVSRDGVKGPVHVLEVSGGAFNCGTTCTIAQTDLAVTISRPGDGKSPRRQDVVLPLTGTSGSSQSQWNGDTLQVTNSISVITIKQTISRQGSRLIVTSTVLAPGADSSPVVQTYLRK